MKVSDLLSLQQPLRCLQKGSTSDVGLTAAPPVLRCPQQQVIMSSSDIVVDM